jgi:hypothetical protein
VGDHQRIPAVVCFCFGFPFAWVNSNFVHPATTTLAVNGYLITDSIEVTAGKYLTYAIDSENELPVAVRRIYLVQRDGPQSPKRDQRHVLLLLCICTTA